ncbi:MAG: hypothetical protein WCL57_19005, partial [Chloroflexota bacterium]
MYLDIKPSNILIADDRRYVLFNFGILTTAPIPKLRAPCKP